MGYLKEIEKVCIDGEKYSAVSTPGEMRKRGVEKANCVEVENKIVKIELVKFYATSGAIEYGMEVQLDCTFESGESVKVTVDASDYLWWVQNYTTIKGVTEEEFTLLFKGVVVELVPTGSKKHKSHLVGLQKQKEEKEKLAKVVVKVGDIVNINSERVVYLGDYFYYKPNIRKDKVYNKLRKYKIYLAIDEDGNWDTERGKIHIESGKTLYNQPDEILGRMDINMGELKEWAENHYATMHKRNHGYRLVEGYWSRDRPYDVLNNKAYVLANISKTKDGVIVPSEDEILRLAWVCGWAYDDKVYETLGFSRGGRRVEDEGIVRK